MSDTRPVVLIPAYMPLAVVVEVTRKALASGVFQAAVCVDDGSGLAFQPIFDALIAEGAVVLRHAVNLGKGMALRTGLNHIACAFPHAVGTVTADADGQHLPDDIVAVGKALVAAPDQLVLGTRQFVSDSIPLRSRLGNLVTRNVVRLLIGVDTTDTQTGLRGIPHSLVPRLLRLSTSGYDFELEMLVVCQTTGTKIKQAPISTVYLDHNTSSHFRPLRDSLAIYFVLARYTANSALTAIIDYAVFAVLLALGNPIFGSMVGGRIVAGGFNFLVGKTLVFKSSGGTLGELTRYVTLVVALMLVSYGAILYLVNTLGTATLLAKFIVEVTLFLLSFAVQRLFVFGTQRSVDTSTETDWDTYYAARTSSSSPTRKITRRLLLAMFDRHVGGEPATIMEFGGGDSCFYAGIRRRYTTSLYRIADRSKVSIDKFVDKFGVENTEAIEVDLLAASGLPTSDLVFSVGLIEHFDVPQTAAMIAAHFDAATDAGLVLITYPTPTLPYRVIRGTAELLGIWKFPDERPLRYSEVGTEMAKHGTILLRKMNWFIGLTQEIVVARKHPRPTASAG